MITASGKSESTSSLDALDVKEELTKALTPTSTILMRVRLSLENNFLKSSPTSTASDSSSQSDPPIEALHFFQFLNDEAKGLLVNQLISRFQRTSFTPRDFMILNTPRYTPHHARSLQSIMAEYTGESTSNIDAVNIHCFDVSNLSGVSWTSFTFPFRDTL